MRIVSPLLKRVVYPALHRTGFFSRFSLPDGCAVVNYHGVLTADHTDSDRFLDGNLVQPQVFRKQLQFLKSRYHLIHPEDFRACIQNGKPLPARSVLVTCDDGLLNTLTDMLPVLQNENVPCLFFVTAASCRDDPGMLWYEEIYHSMQSKPLGELVAQLPLDPHSDSSSSASFHSQWWNVVNRASQLDAAARANWMARVRLESTRTRGKVSEKRWRLLSLTELMELSRSGMTIGAHTETHPVLSLCSDDEARREIHESKAAIERALQRPVWAFAYPFGNSATVGDREFHLAREAGFSCAFLNVENGTGQSNQFALPRTHVTWDMSLSELEAHLSGFHSRLQRAVGA